MKLGDYETNTIYCTDALTLIKGLPDESVNCIVTSPPFFALRSYTDGDAREIGTEATPKAYADALVAIFGEARRVLRPARPALDGGADACSSGRSPAPRGDPLDDATRGRDGRR